MQYIQKPRTEYLPPPPPALLFLKMEKGNGEVNPTEAEEEREGDEGRSELIRFEIIANQTHFGLHKVVTKFWLRQNSEQIKL